MKLIRLLVVSLALVMAAFSAAQDGQPFRLVFANTSLSSVLRAVGIRTGANIVYVGKEDPTITLNVTAGNADEALRFVTTAAGMTYRRVGQTFIVAKSEDMRQALEPFGLRYRMTLTNTTSADAASLLRSAMPFLTVQPVGTDQLLLVGTKEDVDQAKAIIAQQESAAGNARATTTIVPVNVVTPGKAVEVLAEMFPDVRFRAVPQGDAGGSVIITGVQGRIDEARQMLAQLDTRNPRPGAEQIFANYEIRYSSAPVLIAFLKDAMPDLQVIASPENYAPPRAQFNPLSSSSNTVVATTNNDLAFVQSNIASPTTGAGGAQSSNRRLPGEMSKMLIIRGPRDRVDEAVRILQTVDLKPKQVMVEVKVVDYSPSNSSELGFNWDWSRFQFLEKPRGTVLRDPTGNPDEISAFPPLFPDLNVTRPGGFGLFSRVPWSFGSILQALVTRREARILATPSVQVVDNEDANVFIGDTIRARVAVQGALGAQNVQIVEFPIGIILLIRPRVNSDGDVTLRVHPVVSTITALDSQNVPQTSTREAETTLVVKNGETIVLGGLIRDEMTKVVREVPFLSKLPLVGELFRSTTTNGRKSEILIFITPKITDGANAPVPGGSK